MPAQPSPAFYFGDQDPLLKYAAGAGATVTATLASLQGVNQVAWEVVSTDDTTAPADYPLTISGPKGSVCSFTADTVGTGLILECVVNNGVDPRTEADSEAMRARAKCFVPTTDGLEVGCFNEGFESGPQGWLAQHNAAIRAAGASNNGTVAPTPSHLVLRGPAGEAYAVWLAPQQTHIPASGLLRVPPGPQLVIVGRDDADASDRALLRWIGDNLSLGYSGVGGPQTVQLYSWAGASFAVNGEGSGLKGLITASAKQGFVESMGAGLTPTYRQSGTYTSTGLTGLGGGIVSIVANGSSEMDVTTATPHGRAYGDVVEIAGVVGTTEANDAWPIVAVVSPTTFTIPVPLTHAYVSGGTLAHVGGIVVSLLVPPDGPHAAQVRLVASDGADATVAHIRTGFVLSGGGNAIAATSTPSVDTLIDDIGIGPGSHHTWLAGAGFLHLLVGAPVGVVATFSASLDLL